MVSKDGKTWEKRPGILSATIHVKENEDVSEAIEESMSNFLALPEINSEMIKKIHDCKHKLYAAEYHLKIIDAEIKRIVDELSKSYSAVSGVSQVKENQILIYETESFLFQVKSNLDLVTQLLGSFYPFLRSLQRFAHKGVDKEHRAGGKVIDILEKNGKKKLSQLIESHRVKWIEEMTNWRDTITHYSALKDFRCFLEEPFKGGDVNIHYPIMPNKQRVDIFCRNTFGLLLRFYNDIYSEIATEK